MAESIRYFIFIFLILLSSTGFANDHIKCDLTSNGINGLLVAGQNYSNTYTCTNTNPIFFPPIQLGLIPHPQSGAISNFTVSGSCTSPLPSNGVCQFILTVNLQRSVTFGIEITVGSLYYLILPTVTATVAPVIRPVITWLGFNSGFAQATANGVGFGTFNPNATDSSGHPITYLCAIISGPGTITCNQNGTFTLSGVNTNTTQIQITATADDASPVPGLPFGITPSKVIALTNNTTEILYPVLEAPQLAVDNWLQAQFGITNVLAFPFQQQFVHRVYFNMNTGIGPGQTALIQVPFYSFLVPNPSGGSIPNQYVDWWNGMRFYIYDQQASLINLYNSDTPVTLYSPGPSCQSGCSQVNVTSSNSIAPTNDPQQLTEYTFAAVTGVPPYNIDRTIVNFDYSAVDQVYLPVAMGAYGNTLVGYTGTVENLLSFRNSLNTFVAATQWPTYIGIPERLPGTFNVVIGNPQLTNTSIATGILTATWLNCLNNVAAPNHGDCVNVNNLFMTNYSVDCGLPGSPTTAQLIEHIYGYLSFCAAPLPSSGTNFDSYRNLQYAFNPNYVGDFNPYTQLIHQTLQMNVYAFSVDDAVAFISTIGDGLAITVGGANGLFNDQQYSASLITNINLGAPSPGGATWSSYSVVCQNTSQTNSLSGLNFTIQLPASDYPCQVNLTDSLSRIYNFQINNPAPLTSTATDITCAPGNNWCISGVIVANANNISTPGPNP